MSDQGAPQVPQIFLSFAKEDTDWKNNFAHPKWFWSMLRNARPFDYTEGDILQFGPLGKWLGESIERTAAFVPILSENYIRSDKTNTTLLEWRSALERTAHGQLVFAPVLIDQLAFIWWSSEKKAGKLQSLGNDFEPKDLTNGKGKPLKIISEDGVIEDNTHKIREFARFLNERIAEIGGQPPPPPPEHGHLVVLGEPSARALEEVAIPVRELVNELVTLGRRPIVWGDNWRNRAEARLGSADILRDGNAIFVQPRGRGDAGDDVDNADLPRKRLEKALEKENARAPEILSSSRIWLWLPKGLDDERFEVKAAQSESEGDPCLRHDSPTDLAKLLNGEGTGEKLEIPVLTVEDVVAEDMDGLPDPLTIRLRRELQEGFRQAMGDVISPAPELRTFKGEMLTRQLRVLDSDILILAVHDLNIKRAQDSRKAREQLESKLSDIMDTVVKSGRRDLKLFRSALLIRQANELPWVKYPSPSRFEDWCLLPFRPTGEGSLRLSSDEASVFRSYLKDWVKSPMP